MIRKLCVALAVVYTAGMIMLTLMPWWPTSLWWLANLIQVFPLWTLALAPAAALLPALIARHCSLIFLAVVSVLLVALPIAGIRISLTTAASKPKDLVLRLMSCNLGQDFQPAAMERLIDRLDPDVILLQEVNERGYRFFSELVKRRSGEWMHNKHLGIFSRFPIRDAQTRDRRMFGRWGGFVARYVVATPAGEIPFFNVHLATPREGIEAVLWRHPGAVQMMQAVTARQEEESRSASQWILSLEGQIVAGDFNMRSTNPMYRHYWSSWKNAFDRAGRGWGHTKYTRWHGVRIDHILLGSPWRAQRVWVEADVGSDHRPIVADLFLSKEALETRVGPVP